MDAGADASEAILTDAEVGATAAAPGDDGAPTEADDAAADATGDEAPGVEEDASTEPVVDASMQAPGATTDAGVAPAQGSSGCSGHAASGTGGGAGALFGAIARAGPCVRRRGARGARRRGRDVTTG